MPTTPTLLEVVERQGDAESERVRDEAAEEAARIRAEADREVRAVIAQGVEAKTRALTAAHGRRLAATRWAARRSILEARERLLARVRQAAIAMLPEVLLGEQGTAQVAELLDDAWAYVGPGAVTVRCQPALIDVVEGLVAGRGPVDVLAEPAILAGIRVDAEGGRVTIDNTFEARLDRMWGALASELMTALAEELAL